MDNQALLDVAVDAVREAGKIALSMRAGLGPAQDKGDKDIVTAADLACDAAIRSRIQQAFPDHDLFTEEDADVRRGSDYAWYADPIDGTINFSRGIPLWGPAIGVAHKGRVVVAAAYLPEMDELYTAVRGQGAFLYGKPIHVSRTAELSRVILSHGDVNVGQGELRERLNALNRAQHAAAMASLQRVKCMGSAVAEGCYVAAGRLDAYSMAYYHAWDVAATSLLVEEAGGLVSALDGSPFAFEKRNALFSNGVLHRELLEVLAARA